MATFQVTSRADAVSRYTITEETQVEALISGIEKTLEAYKGFPVTHYIRHECSAKAIARVADVYRKAGWAVQCGEGDQHDPGAWMSFT